MSQRKSPMMQKIYLKRSLSLKMRIRVAIFDDNENIRDGIVLLLKADPDIDVVGVFSNMRQCVSDIISCRPDIILMDIQMPGNNGMEAIRRLKSELPNVQILVQTLFEDDDRIYGSIMAGASGYVLKNQLHHSLLSAIRELQSGGSPMSPSIARRVFSILQRIRSPKKPAQNYNLTHREKEVLAYLVKGLSYKMICCELNIGYETVRSHMKNIYNKMHVASLTEVVAKAIRQHIVEDNFS